MLSSTQCSPGVDFLRRQASRIISFIVLEHVKRSTPLQLTRTLVGLISIVETSYLHIAFMSLLYPDIHA